MRWSKRWSQLWGGTPHPEIPVFCELVDDRVLVQMDDSEGKRNLRDYICAVIGETTGEFNAIAKKVRDGFSIEAAQGRRLDILGDIVGLPRRGFNDVRYRLFLEIQIQLMLSPSRDDANWTGTHNNILGICRKFIGAGAVPIVLLNLPPYAYLLTVPGVLPSEMRTLASFICEATYAGVLGQTVFADTVWGSVHGAVSGSGLWGSQAGPVAGSFTWGVSISIGGDSC
jgi:hypothetical protein